MAGSVSRVSRVVMAGPLAAFASVYEQELRRRGYTPLTTVNLLRQVARLSLWMQTNGLAVAELSCEEVEEFLALQRAGGRCRSQWSRPGLLCLLEVLRGLEVVALEEPTRAASPAQVVLASFERYLLTERALATGTVRGYVSHARRFLGGLPGGGELAGVTPADVTGLTYLTEPEVDALLAACDQTTWTGRRDHAMFALAIQTGLRISELAGLTRTDITLTTGANVHTVGKGRKHRHTPLMPTTTAVLKAWLRQCPGAPTDPLFPAITGGRLSRDAIEHRLARHLTHAGQKCPSMQGKHVTMHTLRHTAAMRLLLAGNDITVIALWLGHEQIASTNGYLHADMTHKQQAIDRTKPLTAKPGRYRPSDALLAFLDGL